MLLNGRLSPDNWLDYDSDKAKFVSFYGKFSTKSIV